LGQVHKGRLADGREVAIKIQRPGIDTIIKIDLRAILRVITVIKTFTDWERYIDIDAIYNEFSTTIWRELDYIEEGKHAERIAKNTPIPIY
jgi:predicted unusual protein kinase regulating ubiquinone biosynthesis (AarF/ABC1/UbiB family)